MPQGKENVMASIAGPATARLRASHGRDGDGWMDGWTDGIRAVCPSQVEVAEVRNLFANLLIIMQYS